jgi:hypothetical protein
MVALIIISDDAHMFCIFHARLLILLQQQNPYGTFVGFLSKFLHIYELSMVLKSFQT